MRPCGDPLASGVHVRRVLKHSERKKKSDLRGGSMELCLRGGLLGMCPKSHIGMGRLFLGKTQKQNYESLDLK